MVLMTEGRPPRQTWREVGSLVGYNSQLHVFCQSLRVFERTDIELQFSTAPFRQEHNAFNFVAPTEKMTIELDPNSKSHTFDLPVTLHDKCSVAEVIGAGMVLSKPNYDNHLRIEVTLCRCCTKLFLFRKNALNRRECR